MADNKSILDGAGASFVGAADELGDGSFSPKVTLLAGDSTATPLAIGAVLGGVTETAPASDTASSGLNGRLQRIAQRLTSLIALVPAALSGSGNFKVAVAEALPTSGNLIGRVAVDASGLTGGASVYRILVAAATANAQSVKASAGRAYKAVGVNDSSNLLFLKLYNKASAPTVGSDLASVTIPLPPGEAFDIDIPASIGTFFSLGIGMAITTGAADTDTGALAAGDVKALNIFYA